MSTKIISFYEEIDGKTQIVGNVLIGVDKKSTIKYHIEHIEDSIKYQNKVVKEGIEQIDKIDNTNGKNRDWYLSEPNVIDAILYGKDIEIIKLSQMPKYDEVYYTPIFGSKVMYKKLVWMNDESDRTLYKRGLVFKTSDGAVRAAEKMLAALRQA